MEYIQKEINYKGELSNGYKSNVGENKQEHH